ncbi:MAG: diguanylate cyclase domain-containing protein [Acidimicrobiales bacterium]
MADSSPTKVDISAIAHLEEALAHPEPMCLAVIEIRSRPDAGVAGGECSEADVHLEVMEEAQARLRETLRDYDELSAIDGSSFALVLRTLAGADIMGGRMQSLHTIMTRPYIVAGVEIDTVVSLGSSIRIPQESAGELVARVDEALSQARTRNTPGPVML